MSLHANDLSDELGAHGPSAGLVQISSRAGMYRRFFKRILDVLAVLTAALIVLPLIAVLALIVASDGSNPFYWSERVGLRGRNFGMLKLRTMVPDADQLLERYLARTPTARLEWDSTQKLKMDPRITRIGRFLRKTSLDELPQLWNVLIGEMSLVGPRPMMPSQRVLYTGLAYYSLRPGITGPWQVSDRNEVEFSRRADFDREYDRTLCLATDIKLLFATLRVVMKGTGY
ncbi:MAG: sugar transferase [Rhodobacteraceae bacterium]|nr:sugar transferase [Paracoccaceae bacterium]MCP5342479.1 sugar transferase [Paracoccaceae bacterium]